MSEFKHTTDEGEEIIFPEGKPASRATPAEELRAQVMDVNVPKSEREWWARYVITELEQELELTKKLSDGFSSALIALEQENERLLDICKVTRIMLRGVLRERDFGWCMGEVTEIVKRLDAVVLGQRTALESSDE